ncbi:MAG: hypothetical protein WDZ41_02065 [Candidatus Babeliales bacterium]
MRMKLWLLLLTSMTMFMHAREYQYVGTYIHPSFRNLTGPEKESFRRKEFLRPSFSYTRSGIQTTVNGRRAIKSYFDISKTKGLKDAGFSIQESTNELGERQFTLCLDKKFFGSFDPQIWGPKGTFQGSSIEEQGEQYCYLLEYEQVPLEEEQTVSIVRKKRNVRERKK